MVKMEGPNCILTTENGSYCVSISDRGYISQCVSRSSPDCTESDLIGLVGVGDTITDSINDLIRKMGVRSEKIYLTEGRSIFSDGPTSKINEYDVNRIREILGSLGIRVTPTRNGVGVVISIDHEAISITTEAVDFCGKLLDAYEISMTVSGKKLVDDKLDRTKNIERSLSELSRKLWLSHLTVEKIISNSKCIEEISAEFPDEPLIP